MASRPRPGRLRAHPVPASVTGLEGLGGLTFSGSIQGIQIDVGKLIAGQFPIVGLTSIGVTVAGNLFGGQIDATLIGGILKLNAAGQMIAPTDTSTPVAARVFFAGLTGGFKFAGLSGFQIQLALSQLGPLGITISVSTPTGILLDPDTGLTINNFTAGVQFFTSLPSYTDPKQLANLSIASPTIVSPSAWLASVEAQVVKQYQAIQANPGISGFAAAFTQPMLITGSATIYSIYTSQQLFNGQVGIEISTDGKFFVEGILNFAANHLSISGSLYADLSHVTSGSVVVLFLAKIPDQVNLLTIDGSIKMGFTNPSGQEVTFKTTPPVSMTPTATPVGPMPGKNVGLGAINGEGYVDVTFPSSPANDGSAGFTLIPGSVTNLKPAISISSGTIAVDNSQPPIQVGANLNTYRFWLTGVPGGGTSVNVTFNLNAVAYANASGHADGERVHQHRRRDRGQRALRRYPVRPVDRDGDPDADQRRGPAGRRRPDQEGQHEHRAGRPDARRQRGRPARGRRVADGPVLPPGGDPPPGRRLDGGDRRGPRHRLDVRAERGDHVRPVQRHERLGRRRRAVRHAGGQPAVERRRHTELADVDLHL